MAVLEKIAPRLYREANRAEDPRIAEVGIAKGLGGSAKKIDNRLPGLFPREMRLPTDTAPKFGWKYDWNLNED